MGGKFGRVGSGEGLPAKMDEHIALVKTDKGGWDPPLCKY